jgi:nucleoid-associated protein YgaU
MVLVALLVAGVPTGLITWGQLGALRDVPWHNMLVAPDGGTMLLAGLTAVAWLAWLSIVLSLTEQVAVRLSRGRVELHVPGTGWFRPAAAMLAVAIVGVAVTAAATAHPAFAGPIVATPAMPGAAASTAPTPAAPYRAATEAVRRTGAGVRDDGARWAGQVVPSNSGDNVDYLVQPGDDLWSLAQRFLGTGTRWREIVAANPTFVLDPTGDLPAGAVLAMPVDADVAPSPPHVEPGVAYGSGAPASIEVADGDTLWSLADEYLGAGSDWPRLYDANLDVVANPDVIEPGWQLRVPRASVSSESGPATIMVADGDTLWSLADRYLGDGAAWPTLFDANRDVISDPGIIEPGWSLRLPGGSVGDAPNASVPSVASDPPSGTDPGLPDQAASPVSAPGASTVPVPSDPGLAQPASPGGGSDEPTASASESAASQGTFDEEDDPADALLERAMVRDVLGPIGVGLADLLLAAIVLRRQLALRRRPLGRRLPRVDVEASRFETALSKQAYFGTVDSDGLPRHGDEASVVGLSVATPASDALGAPARRCCDDVPPTSDGNIGAVTWLAPDACERADASGRHAECYTEASEFVVGEVAASVPATAVRLAIDEGTDGATCDLADVGVLSVVGPDSATRDVVAAVAGQLVAGDATTRPDIVLVGESLGSLGELSDGTVEVWPNLDEGMAALRHAVDERELLLGLDTRAHGDPDAPVDPPATRAATADPLPTTLFPHTVYCFDSPGVDVDAPALAAVGMTAIVPARRALAGSQALLVDETGVACWEGGDAFAVQALTEQARACLGELVDATSGRRTEPAPWWDSSAMDDAHASFAGRSDVSGDADGKVADASDDCDSIEIRHDMTTTTVHPDVTERIEDPRMNPPASATNPRLLVLGPVEIVNARGVEPARAAKSCAEYLGWLVMHSGRTSANMTRDLMVAEGTRRSNVSRLRNWLGEMADGSLYLPDAYSGRLEVDSTVRSDWDDLLDLLGAGVSSSPDEALESALLMMRGAPLADAAPNQWHWAEEWRVDMASAIRDVGVVLAQRALERRDIDEARWAASRALVAAPEDELLMMARIRTEYVAGNRAEMQRLIVHVTRQARELGVDLSDDMIALLREVADHPTRPGE